MRYVLFLAFLLSVTICDAQSLTSARDTSAEKPYSFVDQMPVSKVNLNTYLSENLHYPREARTANIQGKVIVRFVVDEKGKISNSEIMKGIGGGCDEEALRVVKNMPQWTPGKQGGKTVKVWYTLPINFKLSK